MRCNKEQMKWIRRPEKKQPAGSGAGQHRRKQLAAMAVSGILLLGLAGCGSTGGTDTVAEAAEANAVQTTADYYTNAKTIDTSDLFTDRDLAGSWEEKDAVSITLSDAGSRSSADSVQIDGQTITITEAGTYLVTGSLSDGQIQVDAAEDAKIQIVLQNVRISNDSTAAIYVKQAKKVFITAADGTQNTLQVSGDYVNDGDDNIDAVIFAKDDLTLNGTGTLTIEAAYGHGIVAKDDLVMAGLTLDITAKEKAVNANNSIRVASGSYELTAGDDGLHAKDADKGLGFIYIADGTFTIASGDDGIHAHTDLIIDGGTIDVTKSKEGLEANTITLNDGKTSVIASDDGLNASAGKTTGKTNTDTDQTDAGLVEMGTTKAGNAAVATDLAVSSNNDAEAKAGDTDGLDKGSKIGTSPNDDAQASPASGDDLQDAPSGDKPLRGGRGGFGGMDAYDASCLIVINGGELHVNAEGDGIDSNGSLRIAGGKTYVEGPTGDGNGSIDIGGQGSATITGGYFIATGSSGMAVQFSEDSTQGCILQNVDQTTGEAALKDTEGNTLISLATEKQYSCVQVSAPEITSGSTYTLQAGSQDLSLTMDGLLYGTASGLGGPAQDGFRGPSQDDFGGPSQGIADGQDQDDADGQAQNDAGGQDGRGNGQFKGKPHGKPGDKPDGRPGGKPDGGFPGPGGENSDSSQKADE